MSEPTKAVQVTELELAPINRQEVAVSTGAGAGMGLSIERAFQAIVEGQIDAPKLAVMKELLAMDAERKFNGAFVALQSDTPVIVATTVIPNRGKYARFEDIMAIVGPLLSRHGFTVSFSQDFKEGRILETCTLSHAAGHSRSNTFAVRTGGRADSDTQSDCKAATTAKRNALCNALNVTIRQDCLNNEDDAGIEGDPNAKVTPAQAQELEHRAQMTNSNIPAFLKLAQSGKFEDIPANRYAELDHMLSLKERRGR